MLAKLNEVQIADILNEARGALSLGWTPEQTLDYVVYLFTSELDERGGPDTFNRARFSQACQQSPDGPYPRFLTTEGRS